MFLYLTNGTVRVKESFFKIFSSDNTSSTLPNFSLFFLWTKIPWGAVNVYGFE